MIRRLLFTSFISCFASLLSIAQSDVDALRFSTNNITPTARSIGVSNAFNSVGADQASAVLNPAGIARYKTTEFIITPSVTFNNSKSNYFNNPSEQTKASFAITNFGIVLGGKYLVDRFEKFKGLNIAIVYSKLNTFNERFTVSATNDQNSLLDKFSEILDGVSEESAANDFAFNSSLAFLSEIIIPIGNNQYQGLTNGFSIDQEISVERSGSSNELTAAFAGNINNKLYVGFAFGLPILRFNSLIQYNEIDTQNLLDTLNRFSFSDNYKTSGFGLTSRFGIIYTPINSFRLGFNFQTPILWLLDDEFNTTLTSDFESFTIEASSPAGVFDYKLKTPLKFNIGASYIIKKRGFISFDYELTAPNKSEYKFDGDDDASSVNNDISSKYKPISTIRGGVEMTYKMMRFRSGISYKTSPFKSSFEPENVKTNQLSFSGGLGFRYKKFFLDLAYQRIKTGALFVPYILDSDPASSPSVNMDIHKNAFFISLGYKL